jgi:hypothetical protein
MSVDNVSRCVGAECLWHWRPRVELSARISAVLTEVFGTVLSHSEQISGYIKHDIISSFQILSYSLSILPLDAICTVWAADSVVKQTERKKLILSFVSQVVPHS